MIVSKLKKQPAILGLVVWFSFMWSWALQTDSLELAGSKKQGTILAIIVLIINVSLSVFIVRKFLSIAKITQEHLDAKFYIPALVVIFAFADYAVGWLNAILWIGPQGRIDSLLPIGSASLLVLRTPFIFSTRFIGLYGLSGFVLTIIYLVSQKKYRALSLAPLLVLSLLSIIGWGFYRHPNGTDFKAKIVSETLVQRVPQIVPKDEALVVFPEYGLEKITNKNVDSRIAMDKNDKSPTYFVGSTQLYTRGRIGHQNRMLSGNTRDGITDFQDKYRLIPGGEDLPYIVRTGLRATGQKNTLDYFSFAKSVIKGPVQLKPVDIGNTISVGVAVCSSIIAPQDYRSFALQGATVFANSASLKPFNGSRLFAWQQQSFGRFMAVANSRYFLQSANSATAYAYDNNGSIIGKISSNDTVSILAKTNGTLTLYTHVGEYFVLLGGLTTTFVIIKQYMRGRYHDKKK
ncbi:MAG: hypothetical protein NTX11_00670 [Candidatus Saccharibacteria bacterium]|nr:hypothetical protein [Candidatus Saccharibacteria bacterium]